MKKYFLTIGTLAFMPFLAQAQVATSLESLMAFLANFFTKGLIPVMISLGLVYLIYAVLGYMQANDNAQGRAEKKQQIFWAIIGLFVILSIWSLVAITANTFSIFGGGDLKLKG